VQRGCRRWRDGALGQEGGLKGQEHADEGGRASEGGQKGEGGLGEGARGTERAPMAVGWHAGPRGGSEWPRACG